MMSLRRQAIAGTFQATRRDYRFVKVSNCEFSWHEDLEAQGTRSNSVRGTELPVYQALGAEMRGLWGRYCRTNFTNRRGMGRWQ